MSKSDKDVKSQWNEIKEGAKKVFDWLLRYPVALVLSVLVIAGASVLMAVGVGDNFNVGGIIKRLFGKSADDERIPKANRVPKDRSVDKEEADEEGWVQKEVTTLDQPKNPFRDKSKIKVKTEDGEKEIKLPEGVLDKDVDRVLRIEPEVFEVEVKDQPDEKVTDEDLELLE